MHTSLPSENLVVSLDMAKAFLSFGGFHTQGFSGYLVRAASEKNVLEHSSLFGRADDII